ncbi:MAG: PPC domain-containing DNA-binding protein [bacterium]
MEARDCGRFWLLRLAIGEDVVEVLPRFVREQGIGSGLIQGLGAADEVELGLYDLATRSYHRRTFTGDCEIVALTGNIAWDGDNPVCHLHCVISDETLAAHGGHLYRARVSVTCEVAVIPGEGRLDRVPDERTGLKLLDLGPGA